nr:immunoglobulin heavy chain junction region [Mus musculus]MBK4196250.1 immunoglobulin heavy chain junction region [Mus musculus]
CAREGLYDGYYDAMDYW